MKRRIGGGLHSCLTACPVRGLGVSGPLNRRKAEACANILTFPSVNNSEIKATFELFDTLKCKLRLP